MAEAMTELQSIIALEHALTREQAADEVRHCVEFFRALLDLDHGTSPQAKDSAAFAA